MSADRKRIEPRAPAKWSAELRRLLGVTEEQVAALEGSAGERARPPNILLTIAYHPSLLEPFLGMAHRITLTTPAAERGLSAAAYAERVAAVHPDLQVADDLETALEHPANAGAVTLVGGSLYLVGELLARTQGGAGDPGDPGHLISASENHPPSRL